MSVWAPTCRLTVGDVHYPPGGSFGPRLQRNLQLVYVWSGELTVWVDGRSTLVREGESVLLMPRHRERFRFAADRPTHHGWCEVLNPVLHQPVERRLAGLANQPAPTPDRIRTLSDEALGLRADVRWAAQAELESLCGAILYEFLRSSGMPDPRVEAPPAGGVIPDAVGRALDLIHRDYATIGGARRLADEAGVSQQHLGRLFAKYLGTSPAAYLWKTRTERAIDLIRSTGLPLGEVASQTGFSTQFHLSRRVREATGASPHELRTHLK